MWAVPRLCEFYPGICLTTEEKAQKNLSQGRRYLSQVRKNLRVQYTYYQNTHTLQNLHTHTHARARARTHARSHITNPTRTHAHAHTHTRPHITKQYKTTTIQIKTTTLQDIPKWIILCHKLLYCYITVTKTICDSVNLTRLPKEVLLPDWARLDKQGKKDGRV